MPGDRGGYGEILAALQVLRTSTFGILHTNFYEKALFVKPTWRPWIVAECINFCPIARYASIRCEYAIGGCGLRSGPA
jgi:hypothetical protein